MKKFVSMLLFMSFFFTMFASVGQAASAAAEVVPKLFLNGQLLKSEVNPQIINNATVVPVRTVSEGLGFQITWDNTAKTATVNHGTDVIKLKLNDKVAMVNDQMVQMDTTASIIKGMTLVPLRFIGEQFGLDFEWKATEKEVHMYDQSAEPTDPTVPPVTNTAGWITQVAYEGNSSLTIHYDGAVKANKPLLLDNPKRVVFDFPYTAYATDLTSQLLSGQIEVNVSDSTYLQKFRYSLFSNSPETARLVIEIGNDTGYVLTEDLGKIQLSFMSLSDVPTDPNAPIDPPIVNPPASNDVFDVVIDPGHGGSDPGAKSVLNKWEKEFNLSVGLKMKALLEKESKIKVHFTRTGDTYPSLDDRIKFAENLKADLFLSIHANSGGSSASGAETYYYRANSKSFADVMHKHLIAGTGIKDRGVKKEAYKVIKQTTMPAVLIEAGFLSNTSDAKILFNDAAQNRIAAELVAGIKEYLNVK
ncbi:N-acetylmuramoyl-L-alanine amidase [Paenibacillus sp. PL91]|uniref:N-acetylmuramoyl-L-alanine amidase n=1 Tax=Paenibacillus sp. PL91 TaxID=2729538 RepID=UPI00145CF884|nr:N-acetylmuramoyl-L-alanine amidase [Paenibacillus sp. PL91]MBC9198868.1 N-acetylmuramoyl-L-alanine amidase [Paenibacillus sp. PL91]